MNYECNYQSCLSYKKNKKHKTFKALFSIFKISDKMLPDNS